MRRLHVSICLFTIVLAAGSTYFAAEKSNLRVKMSTFGKMPDDRTIEPRPLTEIPSSISRTILISILPGKGTGTF
jgi:hypothetical protein